MASLNNLETDSRSVMTWGILYCILILVTLVHQTTGNIMISDAKSAKIRSAYEIITTQQDTFYSPVQ